IEDRWAPVDGVLVEAGLRLSSDNIVGSSLLSPRFSVAYAPKWLHETKVAAGIGIFHDALNLGPFGRQDQVSVATFFDPTGQISRGPVETAFGIDQRDLRAPHYRTVSVSVERKLPFEFYGRVAYIGKVGRRGFAFAPQESETATPTLQDELFLLRN